MLLTKLLHEQTSPIISVSDIYVEMSSEQKAPVHILQHKKPLNWTAFLLTALLIKVPQTTSKYLTCKGWHKESAIICGPMAY